MGKSKTKLVRLISILAMLVVVSSVFAIAFTFAGDELNPDAVASYSRDDLKWNVPIYSSGVAKLDIFGKPASGSEYPLIHPFSNGQYFLRIRNTIHGPINYMVYIYTDDEYGIPIKFDIKKGADMFDLSSVPAELSGKKILAMVGGEITKYNMKNLAIDWKWDSVSDEADTALGDLAADREVLFDVNVLIIVEDNNLHQKPPVPGNVRFLHRAYVKGYPEGDFRPDGNMTRAETAAIFARILANYDETKLTKIMTDFNDIPWDVWYTKYIAKLEHANIIKGYPDGSFRPDGSITRAEFASVCVRYYENNVEKLEKADISFFDLDSGHWAYNDVRKAVQLGYVNGYPDGSFKPDEYITRAEVVTVVNRMLSRSADESYVDSHVKDLVDFSDLTSDKDHWAYYEICEAANEHYATFGKNSETWYAF